MSHGRLAALLASTIVAGVAIGWTARGMRSPDPDDTLVGKRLAQVCNETRSVLVRLKLAAEGTARAINSPDRIYAQLDAVSHPAAVCADDREAVFRIMNRDYALAPEEELKPRVIAMITDILALVPSRNANDARR